MLQEILPSNSVTLQQEQLGDHVPSGGRHVALWVAFVCAAAFGPYVAGAMTGQLVVLALGAFVILTGWPLLAGFSVPMLLVAGLWIVISVIAVIADLWRPLDPGFYGSLSAVHSMWWLLMPLLVVITSCYWTSLASPESLMKVIARVIAIAMTVNSVVSAMQLSTKNVDLGGILQSFWGTGPAGAQTVAQAAAENSRYTGIFDQPAEAGVAYGIALLCAVYLLRRGERWYVVSACAVLIIAGGVLSVSKVFLFVALPIGGWVALRSSGTRLRILSGLSVGAAAFLLAGAVGWLPAWGGGGTDLDGFLHPAGSLTTLFTAGRYGSGGTLGPVTADVLRTAPWAGFGAQGLNTPYDSLWLEILVLSGIFGVILVCAILAVLGWQWLLLRKAAPPAESMLAGSVLLLAVVSSAGFPSLTSNRAGTLIWLVLGVYLSAAWRLPATRR